MRFRHFLTTNYDPCIEFALKNNMEVDFDSFEWQDSKALSRFLTNFSRPSLTRSVVYLHGRYSSPDKIILTESSYVQRYIASDDARRKLLAIFMTHPVVFIGFSINDPDFATVMREVTARLQSNPLCHYAIMGYGSEPEREAYRERMRGKFGVEPVFYSYAEGSDKHANMTSLLAALQWGTPPKKQQLQAGNGQDEAYLVDPLDPNKRQWGQIAEANNRRLRVQKTGESSGKSWIQFNLIVEATTQSLPLEGEVVFHLHPTFHQSVRPIKAQGGKAMIEDCKAYGAFTVGASCDDGDTKLELDLASVRSLPSWFRRR
ncbi:MAG: hypothetical protein JWR80_9618 [Bradyrhizobium sp.]|nr:hypothetical protein [Bradyrhizobium sp.]